MKRKIVIIIKVLGILLVVIGLLYAGIDIIGAIALSNARSELEKAGRPMSSSQIIPPAVSDLENAAPLYETAMKILEATPLKEGSSEKISEAFSKLDFEKLKTDGKKTDELRTLLKTDALKDVVALVEKGNAREKCRYNLQYQNGPATLLPHLSFYRQIGNILRAKAIIDSIDGKSQEAWSTAIAGLKFAGSLHDEPCLISQLVRSAVFQNMAFAISALFESSSPDERQMAVLLSTLKSFEDMQMLVKAIDAERLLFGDFVFNLSKSFFAARNDDLGMGILGYSFFPTFRFDYAFYLRRMDDFAKNVELPYSQAKEDWEAKCKIPWFYPMSKMILPSISGVRASYAWMPAKAKVMRAGIALLQHGQAKGFFSPAASAAGCGIVMSSFSAGPIFSSSRPGLISDPLPTTSTPSLSGWMYFRAAAFTSAAVTFSRAAR